MSVRIQSAVVERACSCHGRPGSRRKGLLGSHQGRHSGGTRQQSADTFLHRALEPPRAGLCHSAIQALSWPDVDMQGACGEAGLPLLLRFIIRLGICSFGEQSFGITACDSEKEKRVNINSLPSTTQSLAPGTGYRQAVCLSRSGFSFYTL